MKSAAVIAVGLVLLWLVVTGRTGNFAQAWRDLQGGTSAPGGSGTGQGTGAAAPPAGSSAWWDAWGRVFRQMGRGPGTPVPAGPTSYSTPVIPPGFGTARA